MIDADKCYDRVPLEDLAEAGAEEARLTRSEGLEALVGLAVEQYGGGRSVQWGGAISEPRHPSGGMMAGCNLANGILHVYTKKSMVKVAR